MTARAKRKKTSTSPALFIEDAGQLRLTDKSAEQLSLEESRVECLGLTFESDEARRAYFLEKLREKLQAPEFRKIEGFPIGADDDILALSDPPYYTACPNPFIEDFIRRYGRPYDPQVPYSREPFAADVSEGKNDPIYVAHSYHTKVPHQALMRFILHYTEPGDIVLDGFCGTGMTGVAAQMCASAPPNLRSTLEQEVAGVQWGARIPILLDLSPLATFIAHNYNTPVDVESFRDELSKRLSATEDDIRRAYKYSEDEPQEEQIGLVVWSDVYVCSECSRDIVYWGNGIKRVVGEIDPMKCPHCSAVIPKTTARHKMGSFLDPVLGQMVRQPLQVPVIIRGQRTERLAPVQDQQTAERCLTAAGSLRLPVAKMLHRDEPWGDVYRAGYHSGITHVHHFYNPRQLLALATLHMHFRKSPLHRRLQLVLTSFAARNGFRGNRFVINKHNPNGRINGPLTNCLYLPSLLAEQNIIHLARSKGQDIMQAFRAIQDFSGQYCLSTESASGMGRIPSESVDYIFIAPPFGANIMYSEMNFIVESWLGCSTAEAKEAIISTSQGKNEEIYRRLMTECLCQFYRVLKPGRWLTMEFHNSQNSVWNAIQTALGDAGFVIADVRILDKGKGTVYQEYYVSGATKNDLVISAYKPNGGLEERFRIEAGSEEGVWDFVKTHLRQLPVFVHSKAERAEVVAERQNYLLFDRMVAFHVQRGVGVPISATWFYAGLKQRFPEREGMFFLPEQAAEYDKERLTVREVQQLTFVPQDEASAILWLRKELENKPQTFQDLHPKFTRDTAGWMKHERPLELREILEGSFLCYPGTGAIPEQVWTWMQKSSTLREKMNGRDREAADAALRGEAKDRWYVPDPNKAGDLEKLREKALLKEFDEYRQSAQRKLKVFRMEAVRAGFKAAWTAKEYGTILAVARKLPEEVLQEDEKLLMWYDQAVTRVGGEG
jgi:DNA-directed RNA polymerase subunit RPC12/RpoP/16S rRNA G966 N2-methylase RsmD